MELDDVRTVDGGEQLDLGLKPTHLIFVEPRAELQRLDRALLTIRIGREVHDRHATSADLFDDRIGPDLVAGFQHAHEITTMGSRSLPRRLSQRASKHKRLP